VKLCPPYFIVACHVPNMKRTNSSDEAKSCRCFRPSPRFHPCARPGGTVTRLHCPARGSVLSIPATIFRLPTTENKAFPICWTSFQCRLTGFGLSKRRYRKHDKSRQKRLARPLLWMPCTVLRGLRRVERNKSMYGKKFFGIRAQHILT